MPQFLSALLSASLLWAAPLSVGLVTSQLVKFARKDKTIAALDYWATLGISAGVAGLLMLGAGFGAGALGLTLGTVAQRVVGWVVAVLVSEGVLRVVDNAVATEAPVAVSPVSAALAAVPVAK